MSRTQTKQVLFVGGPADGVHCIVDCDAQGFMPPHVRAAAIRPMSWGGFAAEPVMHPELVTVYKLQQLRDDKGRDFHVYAAEGVNLIAALIDGYRKAPAQ